MRTFPVFLLAALLGAPSVCALAEIGSQTPSQQIDALIAKGYTEHGVTPNAPASDEIMVRRLYLDLAGRIPTAEEASAYLASTDQGKSEKLISELLASEGYVNHWFNYWADVLRLNRTANNSQTVAPHYTAFIKTALRENRPYDEFVRELLTTDGAAWDSGAIGYYLRDRGMPLDNMSNTVRIFLGTRLECAQCHDHPFDTWTQMDYFHMAAFSYDMQSNYRSPVGEGLKTLVQKKGRFKDMEKGDRAQMTAMKDAFQEVVRPLRYTSIQREDKTLKLPDDYQYDNAKPGDAVEPKTMFGTEAAPDLDSYAAWMTSKENPRFTTVIANRLWKQVFGIGLIEPVDEITDLTHASNPELMAYLESEMKRLDYDLKAFLEILYHTDTYHRSVSREEVQPGEAYYFPGPVLRRMKAEQIWDSFVTLINPEPDTRPEGAVEAEERQLQTIHKIHDSIYALAPEELVAGLQTVAKTSAEGVARNRELTAQIAEARKEKDEEKVKALSREANGFRSDVRSGVREYIYEPGWEKLVASGEAAEIFGAEAAAGPIAERGTDRMMSGMSSGRKTGKTDRGGMREYMQKGIELGITERSELREFVEFMGKMVPQAQRAANLPSPAPNGHFLREFGQSDRDVIENASGEAALPQALQLLNGPYAEALTNEYGVLGRKVVREETPEGRLDVIYLSLYSRYPTEAERAYIAPFVAELGNDAYKDLVYAILNTQQFLFVQ